VIADDGFAGAGGWDLAARELGIESRGIENMKEARATRDAAGLVTIHDDVWTFVPDGKAVGKIDSPPCQTFSAAGKGSGRKALEDVLRGIRDGYYKDRDHLRFLGLEVGDERTSLVLTPLYFATQYDYEWLAWEQVPTVLPVWEACAEVLRAEGWSVWTGLLQAEMFGVPQTRKRAFLLASRTQTVLPPAPTHSRYPPQPWSAGPHHHGIGSERRLCMGGRSPRAPRVGIQPTKHDHCRLVQARDRRRTRLPHHRLPAERAQLCARHRRGSGRAPVLPRRLPVAGREGQAVPAMRQCGPAGARAPCTRIRCWHRRKGSRRMNATTQLARIDAWLAEHPAPPRAWDEGLEARIDQVGESWDAETRTHRRLGPRRDR
jgi:site-specific DNA-cytosine methylase